MSIGVIFTYLLTGGGALLGLIDPFSGLLVYICFAILRPESIWFTEGNGNFSRIVACALLVGWVAQQFGRWRLRHPDLGLSTTLGSFVLQPFVLVLGLLTGQRMEEFGKDRWLIAALIGFLLLAFLGACLAPQQSVGFGFVEAMAKVVLPFLVGITNLDSVRKLKQLAWVMLLSQGYVAWILNESYLTGYNRLHEEGFAGLDNNCVAVALVTATGLGFFLGLGAPGWWRKGLALAAVALMVHAVLFSFSRGGMLALVILAGVAFFLLPKRPFHYGLFGLAIVVSLALAGSEVRARFMTIFEGKDKRDDSAQSRLDLWSNCIDSIEHHPLLGIGPDHWPLVASQYGWDAGKEAHTLWLQLGAELGLPALGCLLAFFGLAVVQLWPLTRNEQALPDTWLASAARMVIASIIAFIVSAQFVSLKSLELPYYVVLLGAGALRLAATLPPRPSKEAMEEGTDEDARQLALAGAEC